MKPERIAKRLAQRLGAKQPDHGKVVREGESRQAIEPHIRIPFEESGCAVLVSTTSIEVPFPSPDEALAAICGEPRLLYGIGPRHATDLQSQGFGSLNSLCEHPRWGPEAAGLLTAWGTPPDPRSVYTTLSTWLPSSHRLFLDLLALLPRDRLLFFDLETLGLSHAPIFLLATARLSSFELQIRQTLISSLSAETVLLESLLSELDSVDALLSYNGKSFDWNLIRERCAFYGLRVPAAPIHVDLLHAVRRAYPGLADHRLGTIEDRVLGNGRTDDLPSALIPEIYSEFLETGRAELLVPILEHNRRDVESLAHLLATLLQTPIHD